MKELNIIICGVGGQGNLLLEKIIGYSALKEGYLVKVADTFGAAQRGGSVASHMRLGSEVSSSLIPQGKCHIILGLEPGETLSAAATFLYKDGLVIVNTPPVFPAKVKAGEWVYPPIQKILELLKELSPNVIDLDATAVARKTAGSERAMNIVMAGVLLGLEALPISASTFREVINQMTGSSASANVQAFDAGLEIGKSRQTVNLAEFSQIKDLAV